MRGVPRAAGARARWAPRLALAAALASLPWLVSADWRTAPRQEGPESAPVREVGGTAYVAINDLARLVDGTKFWDGALRRLELRVGSHVLTFAADVPFAAVDAVTYHLGAPVLSIDGELHVPAAPLDSMTAGRDLPRVAFDPDGMRVVVLPPSGEIGSPRLVVQPTVTRVVLPVDRPDEAVVVARARQSFRVRFGGLFTGSMPDSFPAGSLVRSIRALAAAGGSALEFEVERSARGFRLVPDAAGRRVALEFWSEGGGHEHFAPESPEGPRRLRVLVLDPGHGGDDVGARSGAALEKDLALALAREVEAQARVLLPGTSVVLTRGRDQAVTQQERAEIANRAGADLVVSLHFDGFAHPGARGATAYCPPATIGSSDDEASGSAAPARVPILVLPWRDVALRHAVPSRAAAEAVLSAFELSGQGPTRLRERLAYGLLGVNAPGILLECATLTSAGDRERVLQEAGRRELALAIVRGIAAWQRNE